MRKFFVAALSLAAFSTGWGQTPEYFPLKPGTQKIFWATINQNTSVGGGTAMSVTHHGRNTEEVVGQAKVYDKPAVLVRTTRRDSIAGRPIEEAGYSYKTENYYQTRPQGVFLLANFNLPADTGRQKPDSTRYEPSLQILKLPADSSASWKVGTMRMQGILVDLSAQVAGVEDVEVPAGSYKNCLKVKGRSASISGSLQGAQKLSMNVTGGEFASTSWYAPGVGLVKQEVTTRFVMSSPNLPPEMSAEVTFQQNIVLTKVGKASKEEKKETKK
ncbi:MAG: hypothetical protein L0196_09865 [candidate division Zixibacteria bacterium]|nr:hypothetical protein [candidate division Zixibacteria bacterium]